ncbi:hypothetical protein BCR42DRAFT_451768 [Absidia repens]|uniref:Protein kinase domain-containing protein n=1 Tax=Absidia repens TaxID=90262 RepID=A0A1X2IFZ3_9FUNG|nr:hypothetical protein BCR42DRAFT_451768 [Absidia repens]
MHPLVINDSQTNHHPYYHQPQIYVDKPSTPVYTQRQQHHHHSYDTVRSSYHSPSNHNQCQQHQQRYEQSSLPSTPVTPQPTRRTSMASPSAILSRQRSTKSLKDRRKSAGTISTSSQQYHKPRKCIGDYYVGKTLGKGASGRVKLGIHKHTGEQVAIKIISKAHLAANPAIEKAVRREIAIMKLIRHPNVMTLVDVIDDPHSSDINLILEYVQGGELFEYLVGKGRLGDAEARKHFQHIILGLDFCHHHLICHRDLKPENLLLDSKNNIKIADFGMASLQPTGSMLETSCGSPHYASPEIVAGMPYNGSASDIWSCGVILFALLTGHLPFDDENIRQLLKKVKAGKYVMPDDISRNAQDLIRRILVVDPSKRLTMDQIMAHPWFCESEPANLAALPVPPTANEIGRPVWDPSEIDDRILETIKFLWGEPNDDAIIRALISKEHNMQKVVYVLLQQHSEQYWQIDHDEEEIRDTDCSPERRYHTIGRQTQRNRRCISMVGGSVKKSNAASRPSVPWMPEHVICASPAESPSHASPLPSSTTMTNSTTRRSSTCASKRTERVAPELMPPPPLSPLPSMTMMEGDKSQIKPSQTFYSRFIKNVLTSRRQSKSQIDSSSSSNSGISDRSNAVVSEPSTRPYSTIKATFTGTLRRKNPFSKTSHQEIDTTIGSNQQQADDTANSTSSAISSASHPPTPTKPTLRRPSVSRNKVDPKALEEPSSSTHSTDANSSAASAETNTVAQHNLNKQNGKSLNTKRLSIRVPSAFRKENGTNRFSFTVNGSRRQRKELDMSIFHTQQQNSSISTGKDETLDAPSTRSQVSSTANTLRSQTNAVNITVNSSQNHQQKQPQHSSNNIMGSNHSSNNDVHSSTSTSSASSSVHSPITPTTTHQQASQFKSALRSSPGKGEFLHSPPPTSSVDGSSSSRRESQASIQSVSERRASNISSTLNRPITPSLLSNTSTITTSSGSNIYPPSHGLGSPASNSSMVGEPRDTKPSWINNLFFFKQPKICSVAIPETDIGTILCTLHRLINTTVEAKFYEKLDKQGVKRYKAEIKTKHLGKTRQVKCRMEIMNPTSASHTDESALSRVVQFTQQQGDGIILASVVRHLQSLLDQEYPTNTSSITAGF